ncbi:STY4526/YPO1902 family pathogenicity island replication protein, partial [Klebsiella pneumoniae]|uniref:STY4526/YPO1902 family pathogenicity island replication protein n=1 Tax=Klebsiella pneumoniae TaxID=573 RepID=UPI001D0DEE52
MTWEGKTMIAGIATNALLTQLIMELKSGSIRRCEALGMTMEEIQALNRLSIEDLHYLISTPVSILTVCINHANLKMLMEQAQRERQRAQRIDRALALGGSIELMQRYVVVKFFWTRRSDGRVMHRRATGRQG